MRILAFETSCDETSAALVEASNRLRRPRFKILQNFVSSQIKIHRPFGGVVPNLAKREHLKNLPLIFNRFFRHQKINKGSIADLFAVTVGPGLEPALWTGIEFAKKAAKEFKRPLVGVNHLEGHLYSVLLSRDYERLSKKSVLFPAIALVVSGGHTILLLLKSLTQWKKIGETRDDAAGEAFDKVARLLRLTYPGGPEIEKAVRLLPKDWKDTIKFPRPMLNPQAGGKNYDFSFSGLKTAVLYYLRDLGYTEKKIKDRMEIANIAAAFQEAVVEVLVKKTICAAREFRTESVFLCGGVAANKKLREALKLETKKIRVNFLVPEFKFNTDNAAMVAAAAYIRQLAKKKPLKITAQSNLNL